MTNRSIAAVVIGLATVLPAAGCAMNHDGNGADASIPPDRSQLSGLWYGSATEIGGSATTFMADCRLRINDDGTWTRTERSRGAPFEHAGTWTAAGNRIVFSETHGPRWITLTRSGGKLHGVADMNSRWVMFEFTHSDQ